MAQSFRLSQSFFVQIKANAPQIIENMKILSLFRSIRLFLKFSLSSWYTKIFSLLYGKKSHKFILFVDTTAQASILKTAVH